MSLEALIRWQHPERGLVSPDEFIPLAEETGLIVSIGEWVLREACAQISQWRTSCGSSPIVAVNISGRQLKQSDFASVVKQILDDFGLSSDCIELELTESVLMDNLEHANNVLSELRRLGLRLNLDDFGTGYSSLSYLHRFPVQKLKVDRSFILRLGLDSSSAQIVAAISNSPRDSVWMWWLRALRQVRQLPAYGQWGTSWLRDSTLQGRKTWKACLCHGMRRDNGLIDLPSQKPVRILRYAPR